MWLPIKHAILKRKKWLFHFAQERTGQPEPKYPSNLKQEVLNHNKPNTQGYRGPYDSCLEQMEHMICATIK